MRAAERTHLEIAIICLRREVDEPVVPVDLLPVGHHEDLMIRVFLARCGESECAPRRRVHAAR